jgi:hypothetical protein
MPSLPPEHVRKRRGVPLSDLEYDLITAAARQSGVSPVQFARDAALAEAERVTGRTLPPVRRPAPKMSRRAVKTSSEENR